jgi:hypothetical protein
MASTSLPSLPRHSNRFFSCQAFLHFPYSLGKVRGRFFLFTNEFFIPISA